MLPQRLTRLWTNFTAAFPRHSQQGAIGVSEGRKFFGQRRVDVFLE